MELESLIKLLLAGGSLTLGAFLTAVRAKLTTVKEKNTLHFILYGVAILVILTAIYTGYKNFNALLFSHPDALHPEATSPNGFGIIVILVSIVSSVALIWFTKKHLVGKHHYNTRELDPVINDFTTSADKDNIKLLAGDLNFFGAAPQDMDQNPQYSCLRGEGFKVIQILCTEPKTNVDKIRYGKLLSDMPVELRYYGPPNADLRVRGRMKTLNNVIHLLIYNKVKSGVYEALELDTANANGALYNHIWGLIWLLAKKPTEEQLREYDNIYRNK